MLFNSIQFWLFFVLVLALYRRLPHKAQNRMLLVASYFFYGCWDWRFLSLIAVSTTVDYLVARRLHDAEAVGHKRTLLTLSLCVNLGLLGFFKYYGFFAYEGAALLEAIGIPIALPALKIILPVGISFYTFQTMSYTIDVYRGETRPIDSFWDFALYVSFFPQLVAGPIERSKRLIPQIIHPRPARSGDFSEGLYLVVSGLFKKVVIADNLAFVVDGIFAADVHSLSGADCLVGLYAFAFQIYGDFSGYSSIARGIAKWMGFDLMVNFRMPYLATSPSDFWSRWHISLSTWLRDYLYIPLGGNRRGTILTYRNLALTMLLGGLWHGAGWTYLAWGLFHALILIVYRPIDKKRSLSGEDNSQLTFRHICSVVVMFHLVCLSWLFFRAESMNQVWLMLGKLLTDHRITDFTLYGATMVAFYAGPLMLFELCLSRREARTTIAGLPWTVKAGAYCYFLLSLVVLRPSTHNEFIYFQF